MTKFKGIWGVTLVFLVIGLASLIPRIAGLDQYVITDEVPWLVRSANFYYALGQKDFSETYVAEHPGVITMWIEGLVYLFEFPQYRSFGQGYFDSDKYSRFEEFITSQGVEPLDLLVKSRILTVIINTALLLLSFHYTRLLVGAKPALFSFLLIAFDPFHIATTRLAHLDGLTGGFLFLSLLAFLAFLLKERKGIYLFTSAVSGGLAWLAKLNGLIILPTIIVFCIIDYIINNRKIESPDSTAVSSVADRVLKPVFLWFVIFLLTVMIVFPSAWENPVETITELTVSPLLVGNIIPTQRIEGTLIPTQSENKPIEIIQSIFENNNQFEFLSQSSGYFLRYIKGYLERATPFILIGLAAAAAGILLRLSLFKKRDNRQLILYLSLFWLIYTVFVTLASKSSPKYYLPVYPVLDLIAGLGLFSVVDHFASRVEFFRNKYTHALPFLVIIILHAVPAFRTYPYYSTYFNPLRPLMSETGELRFAGLGEGLDQAARYLNQKPNSEQLKVISWYGTGPFSYFFNGETQPLFSYIWTEEQISILNEMDYMVVYSNQWIRNQPLGLMPHLENATPEHRIWIDGIEFARIYRVDKLPPGVFQPYNPED